jgi:chromosome condensin MukBEF ATPase and DNA-binding subunit MukB
MKNCILKSKLNLMIGIFVLWPLLGCESTYYKTMETMGYHKRDIMVDRVQDARDAQEEAKEQFESALEKFSSVLGFKGGDLEKKYEQLKAEYDASDTKASTVRTRIAAVEDVAEDLFVEWEEELNQYTSSSLKRSSARKLRATKKKICSVDCCYEARREENRSGPCRFPGSGIVPEA